MGHLIADEAGQLAISAGASLTSLFYASLCTVVRVPNNHMPATCVMRSRNPFIPDLGWRHRSVAAPPL